MEALFQVKSVFLDSVLGLEAVPAPPPKLDLMSDAIQRRFRKKAELAQSETCVDDSIQLCGRLCHCASVSSERVSTSTIQDPEKTFKQFCSQYSA